MFASKLDSASELMREVTRLFLESESDNSGLNLSIEVETRIGGVPVKTRVPLAAWTFAGLLTLLSLSSSLVHFAAGEADVSASQQVITTARHASAGGSS